MARRMGHKLQLGAALTALADPQSCGRGSRNGGAALPGEPRAWARAWSNLRDVIVSLLNLVSVSIARGSPERPRGLLLEALAIVEQSGSRSLGVDMLRFAAGVAALHMEWERAAHLHGAAAAQFEHIGQPLEPADQYLAPLVAKARVALGPAAFAAAENIGRALSYEDADCRSARVAGEQAPTETSRCANPHYARSRRPFESRRTSLAASPMRDV